MSYVQSKESWIADSHVTLFHLIWCNTYNLISSICEALHCLRYNNMADRCKIYNFFAFSTPFALHMAVFHSFALHMAVLRSHPGRHLAPRGNKLLKWLPHMKTSEHLAPRGNTCNSQEEQRVQSSLSFPLTCTGSKYS